MKDKDQKLFIIVDINDRKYEFVTENNVEREKWFDFNS